MSSLSIFQLLNNDAQTPKSSNIGKDGVKKPENSFKVIHRNVNEANEKEESLSSSVDTSPSIEMEEKNHLNRYEAQYGVFSNQSAYEALPVQGYSGPIQINPYGYISDPSFVYNSQRENYFMYLMPLQSSQYPQYFERKNNQFSEHISNFHKFSNVNYQNELSSINKSKKSLQIPKREFVIPQFSVKQEKEKISKRPPNLPNPKIFRIECPIAETIRDRNGNTISMRCTCGQNVDEGARIQCDCCLNWVHNSCVNVPGEYDDIPFFCPICLRKKVSCKCGNNLDYSSPLVQCTMCHMWVHKKCENLEFGIAPNNFVCSNCGGGVYQFPKVDIFASRVMVRNEDAFDRYEIISSIPDGHLRKMIIEDLNEAGQSLETIVLKYISVFANTFFSRSSGFWKTFTQSFESIFGINESDFLSMIDDIFNKALYTEPTSRKIKDCVSIISDSIIDFVNNMDIESVNRISNAPQIYINEQGRVITPCLIKNNSFICDIPGYVMHSDEVDVNNGIPRNIVSIHETDIVVDADIAKNSFFSCFRRSFHYNCIAKLYKHKGQIRIGLFATRTMGPVYEKSVREVSILEQNELLLPFEPSFPYKITEVEWKDINIKRKRRSNKTESIDDHVEPEYKLSLLSSFENDEVPPLPFDLYNSKLKSGLVRLRKGPKRA